MKFIDVFLYDLIEELETSWANKCFLAGLDIEERRLLNSIEKEYYEERLFLMGMDDVQIKSVLDSMGY